MTEPTDAQQPDAGSGYDPDLTTDLTAELGTTSFFPPAEEEPSYAVEPAEQDEPGGAAAAGYQPPQFEQLTDTFEPRADGPLAPSEPASLPGGPARTPAPGDPGTAGAALADLAGGYGGSYEPYYGTPSPWSSDRLEAIMRDTVDAQVQEQRQLETLLEDVRAALARLAEAPAADPAGAVERLREELAAARTEQEQRFAELAARLDALVPAAPVGTEVATGPSLQDLHDGLAGVRTDMTSLPEQIGPAVTSAVAHGLTETTAQVGSLRESLADTVAETTELRSLVAAHAEHLALLPETVSGLRDLTARIDGLEAAAQGAQPSPDGAPGLEIGALVDEHLGTHLERFGADVTEQLAAVRAQMTAVEESLGTTVRERIGAFEDRLDALHEVLVALHRSEERGLPPALAERLDELDDELRAMRLASEGPTSPMTSVVAQLHASEQRLAHHVDEAVLALAQAVLRRRGGPVPPRDDAAAPALPADELEAAERDDAAAQDAQEDSPGNTADDGAVGDPAGRDDAVGDPAAADDVRPDEAAGSDGPGTGPGLEITPGRPAPGQDPRRGLFRRRP